MGPAIYYCYSKVSQVTITHCNFMNNNDYRGHGAAIYMDQFHHRYSLNNIRLQIINNSDFSYNEGVQCIIYFTNTYTHAYESMYMYYNNTTFYNNQSVSIYVSHDCSLHLGGNILFKNNKAENGAGIYINDHSTVIFGENSYVQFINNSVDHNGSAIFISSQSSITFEQNSIATFNANKGISGTVYSKDGSNITFKATSWVIFNSNSATQYGAGIYSSDNSKLTFTGSSNITFSSNVISTNERSTDMKLGGIIFSTSSHTSFDENSAIMFSNKNANVSAAIFSFNKSSITFKDRSKVTFYSNVAHYCGILTSALFSNIVLLTILKSLFITIKCHVLQKAVMNHLQELSALYKELMSCFQDTL